MAKSTKSGNGPQRSDQRRQELRRNLPKPSTTLKAAILRPDFIRTSVIVFAFLAITGLMVIWGHDQVIVTNGQLMSDTHITRLDWDDVDEQATNQRREEARRSSPRIYQRNRKVMELLESALQGLPVAVQGKSSISEVADEIQTQFTLDDGALAALQRMAVDGEPTEQWRQWVHRLVHEDLQQAPILDDQEAQIYAVTPIPNRLLLLSDGKREALRAEAIPLQGLKDDAQNKEILDMISSAGFPNSLHATIASRIASDDLPTLVLDQELTQSTMQKAVDAVEPTLVSHREGEVIYRRGDRLSAAQYERTIREAEQFATSGPFLHRWGPRLGLLGLLAALSILFAAYATTAYKQIARNPWRLIALCSLLTAMLSLSLFVTVEAPVLLYASAIAPVLFTGYVVRLAYDQRLAIFLCGVQAAITAMTLGLGVGWFILVMAGSGAAVAQLKEIRNRNSLLQSSLLGAGVLAVGSIVLSLLELPIVPAAWGEIIGRAVLAFAGCIGVGFLVLGILPSIERLFNITTGMTLAELRDPRRPLLQQLQQRAPGTYNHSLQVANIAEAAADAIGADSLLVYVGALYHDIGKMNKPEYFVENRGDGPNKHENLSPAMSLLVIIGHVKDGVELGREYNLPRDIIHFIEAHHGTTLVEYFYHAAKQQAEEEDRETVDEVEYRYPGPKPRTREAAILMLSDCIESASRAMTERKPSQIESLVRDLTNKRLTDGQFDECDLTFKELALIQSAITSRINAIYHGRVSYPDAEESADTDKAEPDGGSGELGLAGA